MTKRSSASLALPVLLLVATLVACGSQATTEPPRITDTAAPADTQGGDPLPAATDTPISAPSEAPSDTPPPTSTATMTPEPTDTPTLTPTPADTATPVPTATPTATPTPEPMVQVVSASANLRDGPGTNYAVVGVLEEGDTALVLATGTDDSWYNILLADGAAGWLAASICEPVDEAAMGDLTVAATIPAPPPTPTPFTPTPEGPTVPTGSGILAVENQHPDKALSVMLWTSSERISFSIDPGERIEKVLPAGDYGRGVTGHSCQIGLPNLLILGGDVHSMTIVKLDQAIHCDYAVVTPDGEVFYARPI